MGQEECEVWNALVALDTSGPPYLTCGPIDINISVSIHVSQYGIYWIF